jgi:hypothetical protein
VATESWSPLETGWLRLLVAGLGLLLLGAGSDAADAPGAKDPVPGTVPLERLFKLPESVDLGSGALQRGGASRSEWKARFDAAREEVEQAQGRLEAARGKLEELASDQAWSMSAPGLGGQAQAPEGSLDYGLRQEIRREREEVALAERRLRELEVEANLAGVPPEWIAPDPPPTAPATTGEQR